MGFTELDQNWFVSFRPFLLKAALANNPHHVMAQLLEKWGRMLLPGPGRAHLFGEEEEQPSVLAADDAHFFLQAAVRQGIPGDNLPSSQERSMDSVCGTQHGQQSLEGQNTGKNVSHLLTSPLSPLTSPEDHLHLAMESQDPPV